MAKVAPFNPDWIVYVSEQWLVNTNYSCPNQQELRTLPLAFERPPTEPQD